MIAPVGAAIGRPSVETSSNVKQNASAKAFFSNIIGLVSLVRLKVRMLPKS